MRNIITTQKQLKELLRDYSRKPAFAFDTETMGDDRINAKTAQVCWLSMANGDRSDAIPMDFPNGEWIEDLPKVMANGLARLASGKVADRRELPPSYLSKTVMEPQFADAVPQMGRAEVFTILEPLFLDDTILKIGHNVRFDIHAVGKYFADYPAGPFYDTLVAAWLLDVTDRGHLGLDDAYKKYCGKHLKKGVGENVLLHGFSEVAEYALKDAEATWELRAALDRRFAESPSLAWLLALEQEVIHPVIEMERTGVRIDTDALKAIDLDLRTDIDRYQGILFKIAGESFNVRSTKDKQRILFSKKKDGGRGLRPKKPVPSAADKPYDERTIYDYSTDAETLEALRGDGFVDALLEYNLKQKLHSGFVLPYLGGESVRAIGDAKAKTVVSNLRNGRVYGSFLQHGTESGRFSSRDPNLQNIPSRTDDGKKLRGIFVADPGTALVVADYSQIEPRIIASLSGDKTMIRTYREGGDVYEAVAHRMKVERAAGKELVLSIAYGVGPNRIAGKIGCSVQEARDLMDYFVRAFPSIPRHKQQVLLRSKRRGYSETITGRQRRVPGITSTDRMVRAGAERQAYNHCIQGSAADVMKIALVNVHLALPEGARMLLTVHDEVVVQTPEDRVEETMTIVKKEMEQARPSVIEVPLVADVGWGYSWAEAK